jgi:hypothetical protein
MKIKFVLMVLLFSLLFSCGITIRNRFTDDWNRQQESFKEKEERTGESQCKSNLIYLANLAQLYYGKPISKGGGGNSFIGFELPPIDSTLHLYSPSQNEVQPLKIFNYPPWHFNIDSCKQDTCIISASPFESSSSPITYVSYHLNIVITESDYKINRYYK